MSYLCPDLLDHLNQPTGSGVLRVYINITRQKLNDKKPTLTGYIHNTFDNTYDTLFNSPGKDVGNEIIRFEDETFKTYSYGGTKNMNVNISYNLDFDTKTGKLFVKGMNSKTKEFENCIYRMTSELILFP